MIKWKHFPHYWPFVRGIHRSPADSSLKSQSRRALKFSLICPGTDNWANNRYTGDLRRHRAHYGVIVMLSGLCKWQNCCLNHVISAVSHSMVSDVIMLAVDTVPSNLSQKKHVFNGAIDVANLDCVLHSLTYSYVSLWMRLRTLFSFMTQVFAMMLNGSLVQSQCLHRHLMGLGQYPQVRKRFQETAWHF